MPQEMVGNTTVIFRVDASVLHESCLIGRDLSRAMGKVNSGIPQVPAKGLISPSPADGAGEEGFSLIKRQELPIWAQREEIIQAISQNQVHSCARKYMSGDFVIFINTLNNPINKSF